MIRTGALIVINKNCPFPSIREKCGLVIETIVMRHMAYIILIEDRKYRLFSDEFDEVS